MSIPRALLVLLPALGLSAREPAFYLDVNAAGTGIVAEVNGFPLYENLRSPTCAYSSLISQYLRSGKNEFSFTSAVQTDAQVAWLEVSVASAPIDVIRTPDNENRLFHQRVEPLAKLSIVTLPDGALQLLAGSCDPGTGPLEFTSPGLRRWAWGARITSPDQHLQGIPFKLEYSGLAGTLARVEFHLLDSATGRHLIFADLKLQTGGSEVPLAVSNITRGRQWLGASTFDTIWLFGFAAEGVEQIRLGNLAVHTRQEARSIKSTLELELPHQWTWESGANVGEALANPDLRTALITHLRNLHETMSSKAPEAWESYFETKLLDLARSSGRSEELMREDQKTFFSGLHAIEGWALEPFDPTRLLLLPINDQVVQARYVDSIGPIESVPLMRPGATRVDRFSVPLFLSLIQGQWTVVR